MAKLAGQFSGVEMSGQSSPFDRADEAASRRIRRPTRAGHLVNHLCRVHQLSRKDQRQARGTPSPFGSDQRLRTVEPTNVDTPKIVIPSKVEAITAANSFAVLNCVPCRIM